MTQTVTDPIADRGVLDGFELDGDMNTPMADILEHMRHAIRQGHPQVRHEGIKHDRVAIVASGPSLADSIPELKELVFAGAKVVTVNGAYQWCLEHNIRPSAQVVLDARASTARFLEPAIPNCLYYVASQCHPDTWAAVAGRERVAIYHSMNPGNPEGVLFDDFYGKGNWVGVSGGTTVTSRALFLLRITGYLRFDLFGVDCCWLGDQHHAFDQPENQHDKRILVTMGPADSEERRQFWCAPWHLKALEDWLLMIRTNGQHFVLRVHGDGLLAYALRAGARVISTVHEGVSDGRRSMDGLQRSEEVPL